MLLGNVIISSGSKATEVIRKDNQLVNVTNELILMNFESSAFSPLETECDMIGRKPKACPLQEMRLCSN